MSRKFQPGKLRDTVLLSLDELKAIDPVSLNVKKLSSFTDYILIASGSSKRHIQSIGEKVIEDYLLTNTYVSDHVDSELLEIELKTFFRADSDNLRKIQLVEERYIQAAFDTIDSHWGGMDKYLSEGLNLNESDIEKLKSIYLE